MRIINLTQHAATAEQLAAGVIDLPAEQQELLKKLMTFVEPPTEEYIVNIAYEIEELAHKLRESLDPDQIERFGAMLGGALWLMGPLTWLLQYAGFECMYAFSMRVSTEIIQPDGSVTKASSFKHIGFAPAMVAVPHRHER